MDEAAIQAELMKGFQQPATEANPMDPTGAGGGNIGTGQVPTPQEQGFSGNDQGQGAPQEAQGAGEQPAAMGPVQ